MIIREILEGCSQPDIRQKKVSTVQDNSMVNQKHTLEQRSVPMVY
jgi:hypothetical protein